MSEKNTQRGGFAIGMVVGLLVGLALALGVALYVTKVPIPFVNKVPQRTPDQDAAELQKNKNWDPNSPLYGKNPAKPGSGADAGSPPTAATTTPFSPSSPTGIPAPAVTGAVPPPSRAAISPAEAPDPFNYFVQAGAYGRSEDAEQQRARLAMLGLEGKLTEREQAGRMVYRVRLGPFDKRAAAEAAKQQLGEAGIDAALVRVQR